MAFKPIKESAVPGQVPTVSQLSVGELAINTNDGLLFILQDNGTQSIVTIGSAPADLPLTGGTLTGALVGTSGSFTHMTVSNGTFTNQLALSTNPPTNDNTSNVATTSWVKSQGYITNVISSLGYTPLNSANASVTLTGAVTGNATFHGNVVSVVTTLSNNYLPLSGGILTGSLAGTTGSFSSTLGVSGRTTLSAMSASTGSFSGLLQSATFTTNVLSAGSGTFTSNLSVLGNTTLVGMSATTGSFSGALIGTTGSFSSTLGVAGQTTLAGMSATSGTYSNQLVLSTNPPTNDTTSNVATTSWVKLQDYVTNVVGSLGYTPLNSANASVTLTGAVNGSAIFNGNAVSVATTLATDYLPIAGGTLTGSLVGTTGSFSSTLGVAGQTTLVGMSATTGSFSGALIGTSGTFTSTLKVDAQTTLAGMSATSGSFTGSLVGTTGSFSSTLAIAGQTTLAGMSATSGTYSNQLVLSTNPPTSDNTSNVATTSWVKLQEYVTSVTGSLGYTPLNSANASVTLTGAVNGSATFNGNSVSVATTLATNYLPIAGGTLTGSLIGTTGSFASTLGVSGSTTLAAMSATSGSFTGSLVGTTGSFSSTLGVAGQTTLAGMSATTGSFSGALIGTSGTFTSTLKVDAQTTLTGMSATSGSFTGSLVGTTGSFSSTLGVAGQTTLAGMSATSGTYSNQLVLSTNPPTNDNTSNVATTSWVKLQDYVTNVISSLGYTPLNSANASVTLTGAVNGSATFNGNAVSVATTLATNYLPIAGGTLTGSLVGTTGSFASTFGVSGSTTLAAMSATTGYFTTSIVSPTIIAQSSLSNGFIEVQPGDTGHSGYISFFNASGTRLGYIGFVPDGGLVNLANDSGSSGYSVGNLTATTSLTIPTVSTADDSNYAASTAWVRSVFPASFGQNGYQQLPNGFLIQWYSALLPCQTTTVLNFPTAFQSGCYSVVGSFGYEISATVPPGTIGCQAISTTQFAVTLSSTSSGADGIFFIAVGY